MNWIAHDYIAEANRPRRAGFAVRFDAAPHRSVSGGEPEFGDTIA